MPNYFYRPKFNPYSGFCAVLNNTINVCQQYHKLTEQFDLSVNVSELTDILEQREYTANLDFEPVWQSSNFDNSCNAHSICDPIKIKEKKYIFDKFFKLKNEEDYFYEKDKYITKNTLAIHLRGTDKSKEVVPPSDVRIIEHIKYFLDKYEEIDRIFLATDDYRYQKLIQDRFSDLLVFREKTISYDGSPIHFISDRTDIYKEVMMDCYLLSKCKYFLYCFSNVSFTSLMLGIDNMSEIRCLNT